MRTRPVTTYYQRGKKLVSVGHASSVEGAISAVIRRIPKLSFNYAMIVNGHSVCKAEVTVGKTFIGIRK